MLQHLPRESATFRATHGDGARWGEAEHLLAGIYDKLGVLVWQPTKDGHAGTNYPAPHPRPGVVVDDGTAGRSELFGRLRDFEQRTRGSKGS